MAYPYSGQGSLETDTQPEPALNDNNDASVGKLALIKLDPPSEDYDALVFMHEVGHNLGAVQVNSPHASRGSHCFDEWDTMCYNDGGTYFTDGGTLQYPLPDRRVSRPPSGIAARTTTTTPRRSP